MTTVSKHFASLSFEEFKAYIEKYPHITKDVEKLYEECGGVLPKKKVKKPKEEET